MRVTSILPLNIESGWLAIANSDAFDFIDLDCIVFTFAIRKQYKIYRNGDCIVVDSVPRVFKAGGRKDYSHVGTVNAPNGEIVLFSIDENEITKYSEAIQRYDLVALPLNYSELVTWVEQTENTSAEYTGLLCISDKVRLVLSKPEATRIFELEQLVAKALRMKGDEKQISLHKIKHEILDMHFDGVKDSRLEMLASSIRLKLPHRGKYKREDFIGVLEKENIKSNDDLYPTYPLTSEPQLQDLMPISVFRRLWLAVVYRFDLNILKRVRGRRDS